MNRNTSYAVLAFLLVMSAAQCGAQSDEQLATLCSQIGVVSHPSVCTKYVTCAKTGSGFVARARSCGANLAFDGTSCVPISQVPDCYAPRPSRVLDLALEEDSCGGKLISCKNCTTLRRCTKTVTGEYTNPKYSSCPLTTPYCSVNKCGSTIPVECKASSFSCNSGDGVFPDPTDCRNLFICNGGEKATNSITCPLNNIASTFSNDCVIPSAACVSAACTASEFGTVKPFNRDQRFYIFCNYDASHDVYKCPKGEIFDKDDCKLGCHGPGKFINPNATTLEEYIFCAALAAAPKPVKCLAGLVFDQGERRCEVPSLSTLCL